MRHPATLAHNQRSAATVAGPHSEQVEPTALPPLRTPAFFRKMPEGPTRNSHPVNS